jgi:hypothetical protein
MAVSIDVEAFRKAMPAAVSRMAARLQRSGCVGDLELAGGGVQAAVRDSSGAVQPWVGVVERNLTSECECAPGRGFCAHAVAVALTAFDAGVRWSGAATPPSALKAPAEQAAFAAAVERLARRQLVALVVGQAVKDRLFAATLLRQAGLLDPADEAHLLRFRQVLRDTAEVTSGKRWDIPDVETAGHRLVAEVEILSVHPATIDMLDLVEQAIIAWDELSGHLIDAYYVRSSEPEEYATPLIQAHVGLCEQLGVDQEALRSRLDDLLERCEYDIVDLNAYAELLAGPEPARRPRNRSQTRK